MDALQMIESRRSIRRFTAEPIAREVIEKIVAEAAYAPSWKNSQTTRYTVIDNREMLDAIGAKAVCGFEKNAKTIGGCAALVVVSTVQGICGFNPDGSYTTNKEDRWQNFDAGIATQTFCLAAREQGVGTVILGIFEDNKVAEVVKLPENEQVTALIAMGYPEQWPETFPARKSVEELVRFL